MSNKCCSCLAEKKKKTADVIYQGDSLCAKCYEKTLQRKVAEAEHNARMAEIEKRLESLAKAQEQETTKK